MVHENREPVLPEAVEYKTNTYELAIEFVYKMEIHSDILCIIKCHKDNMKESNCVLTLKLYSGSSQLILYESLGY